MKRPAIRLVPQRDVAQRGGAYEALSAEPWLTIDAPRLVGAAGHIVEITYRASLWDDPVRPVFRFEQADGTALERIAAGPVAGAGIWIGRVPPGTIRASVSPTHHRGPFRFAIESIRRRTWISLLMLGLRRNPRSTRSAVLTRLIGWGPESDINLAWATGSIQIAHYRQWRDQRRRSPDLIGLDTPRADWTAGPRIHIWIDARHDGAGLEATLQSLLAQMFSGWTATVIRPTRLPLPDDPRIAQAASIPGSPCPDAFLGTLRPGDRLLPHALACVAEAWHRHPAGELFYGDEECDAADGLRPLFKPGWSRLLQAHRPFLGRAVFMRTPPLSEPEKEEFTVDARIPDAVIASLTDRTAIPLHRVVLQTPAVPTPIVLRSAPIVSRASATIIIPTRDQPGRLRRAVESIRARPGCQKPAVLIIDNGSVEAETKRLFAEYRRSSDVAIIEHPGAFNFSLMCNEGAAAATSDVLVFLNDDTEALSADWLDRLKYWAMQPEYGAVGARLTYPDGRLQHIGVLLGMGESAGHFGAFAAPDDAGWAGRHTAVHEVSAVTGACLAVARAKFDAVGGFDAINLPIELSDIDLCLRLAERRWSTVVDPAVHLLHEESASRGGATFRRLDVYESQRAYFKQRWRTSLRDDAFFHPGLSLFSWAAALA